MKMEFCAYSKTFQYVYCTFMIWGLLFKMQSSLREYDFLPDSRFDNYLLNHGLLWELQSVSTLMCAIRCASFKSCISFYFNNAERRCRGHETLMLTTEAGVHENNWNYFYLTKTGKCPTLYAYSKAFEYCVGYEGHFVTDEGLAKCQEHNGRYLLVRTAEENRFASLLAYNFDHLTKSQNRQMRIQGTFDFTDMTWKDDNGNNLTFTQLLTEDVPKADRVLYIKNTHHKENFTMGYRHGVVHAFITICVI
ncbi:uncharacterized protein LOC125653984 [Ostrea edulis]|uniref:uncharacterized protein LOC125653984 n=1 Tax=Ostrea edulis TaxID=37623 RepID=UPI0024AFBB1D|nr:uncharacterized protein LOC125653984 [Ostrea edulis]